MHTNAYKDWILNHFDFYTACKYSSKNLPDTFLLINQGKLCPDLKNISVRPFFIPDKL